VNSARFTGRPASPGLACGPVVVVEALSTADCRVGDPLAEASALREAMRAAVDTLAQLAADKGGDAADILSFQIALLEDDALSQDAFVAIRSGTAASEAWRANLDTEIANYESAEDEHFRARASDLADVRDRVLACLAGATAPEIPSGSIVVADDMPPSRFLGADWSGGALVLRKGSPTSHVAMLARARGVPMIVDVGQTLNGALTSGAEAIVDGIGGIFLVGPNDAEKRDFAERRAALHKAAREAEARKYEPAITANGSAVSVLINVADARELDAFDADACDGIGLVRTELLFEGRSLPDEDTQYRVYRRLAEWAKGKPVVVRTLDAGGDKPIAGLTMEKESNPFLGVRGVRLTLAHPEIFGTQLRALARAAVHGAIEIMVPMVTIPAELEATRALLEEAVAVLTARGVPHRKPPLGMMVEVPAAAIAIHLFDADFYSIGSNDLTQYVMAAGRDIAAVADLADTSSPAVLHLIALVAHHGAGTARKVSLCGDAAGDANLIPRLLAVGVRALSVAPSLVGATKAAISKTRLGTV
jgi:phosphotransferase system enzyme I (PtsI)